jgi:hypothetical protein
MHFLTKITELICNISSVRKYKGYNYNLNFLSNIQKGSHKRPRIFTITY